MKNLTLDSYAINSKVVDAKEFISLSDKEKFSVKTTKIVPPSRKNPFGAIELIYKHPQYVAHT